MPEARVRKGDEVKQLDRLGPAIQGRILKIVMDPVTGLTRGFGFIGALDDGSQYFFHASDVWEKRFDNLCEGEMVTFIPCNDPFRRKLRAIDVRPIDEAI